MKGQINPMIKQIKVGRMNTGNQRWIGRRIKRLLTIVPSFLFLLKAIFLTFSG